MLITTNQRLIQVVDYDPHWPELFRLERELISRVLTKEIVHIHHIGSTAVPGLAAKPVIDILLEVNDVTALDRYNTEFEQLGYLSKGEHGIPGRRFYKKGHDNRTHHIHAFNTESPDVIRHIAFRDYLIAFPQVADEYGKLKQKCAETCNNNIEKYCDLKDNFIKKHEQKALNWMDTRNHNARN